MLALVGNLFYVLVYTGYLKRRGPQNIVLGGAAGAVPPLVGYAAATGSVAVPALWLFALVCLWTPPHFWALALLLKDHYAKAEVPMLPVVKGDRATVRRILGYTVVLVGASVVPVATGTFGAPLPRRGARARRASSWPSAGACCERRGNAAPPRSSTTACSTSRCSSWPPRSIPLL